MYAILFPNDSKKTFYICICVIYMFYIVYIFYLRGKINDKTKGRKYL